ncbi:L-histidine N(alpha)-methyltransferase [Aquisalimonas lutea]|uniref:L-histidine N(alpha)-methyltransferase n=1 Tax=Aquisalimonas lutea TaxID=1327750 RepID=UPI0025B2B328|nr:L-histidine N(alpha)-methyltransferase [Aquisalimonas lutea]MDN3516304.1 L-histidine N(alpha)-methyltransferase [Aquisalimonas lutea]
MTHEDTASTDHHRAAFLADVVAGLSAPVKQIPPKYFYDDAGSELFDRICELPEYYVTRTETAILRDYARDIGDALGARVMLIEPGSGSSAKVHLLLDVLEDPVAYVPVEISREHMLASLAPLRERYPGLEILPVAADFTAGFTVPESTREPARRVVFFPGSTIGNFRPDDALTLLSRFAAVAGPGGGLLLGADLRKSPAVLEPAYDDSAGVTAAFNRNVLTRINRELGGDFDPGAFRHRALWNEPESRVEMHLVSLRDQRVHVGGTAFDFRAGEPIVTEYSHKYTLAGMADLAQQAGFRVEQVWTDEQEWFSVQYLVR